MTTLRVQAIIQNASGIPADHATNTWHFISNSVDPLVDAVDIIDELKTFYAAIDGYMSGVNTGAMEYKVYDLEQAPPRVPILTSTGDVTPDSGYLPNECAMVLSYHGATVSGEIAARRRGRIYLGPLSSSTMDSDVGDVRIDSDVTFAVAAAAGALMVAGSDFTWQWAVFSPTTAGPAPWTTGELIAATLSVVGGHVDNAYDTQRSRGRVASEREFFPGPI